MPEYPKKQCTLTSKDHPPHLWMTGRKPYRCLGLDSMASVKNSMAVMTPAEVLRWGLHLAERDYQYLGSDLMTEHIRTWRLAEAELSQAEAVFNEDLVPEAEGGTHVLWTASVVSVAAYIEDYLARLP